MTCHHVTYNVAEIEPFLTALTAAARRMVVVEMTATTRWSALNPLWLRFHGLVRPTGPTADDLLAILAAMGVSGGVATLAAAGRPGLRELCRTDRRHPATALPAARARGRGGRALADSGSRPAHPVDLGSSGREVVTIWWDGRA